MKLEKLFVNGRTTRRTDYYTDRHWDRLYLFDSWFPIGSPLWPKRYMDF